MTVKACNPIIFVALAGGLYGAEATLTQGLLKLSFSAETASLELSHEEAGVVLGNVELSACRGKSAACSAALEDGALTVAAGALRFRASISAHTVRLSAAGGTVSLTGKADRRALPAYLKDEQPKDRGVLVGRLGPAVLPGARSIFNPEKDFAITAEGAAEWKWRNGWVLEAQVKPGAPLSLRVRPHYYRDELGIQYYSPIRKPPRWQTAPAVAMTWYGIGYGKQPDQWFQSKEWLYPQIDWVAENLLPYNGASLVFQLDDNYTRNDDRTMREISDYIRGKGLVPGIWFTPFVVAPKRVAEEHGDWFLHDAQGNIVKAFGGLDYGWKEPPQATYGGVLNPTQPEGMEKWFARRWRQLSEEWNFDFFKIDGQPPAIEAFRKAVDGGGIEGYRSGLRLGRTISGPDKFVNACSGSRVPVEAIGYVNGSRTGPDTGGWPHDCDILIGWNFLNNIAWYSDPDATANQHRAGIEPVRLNAQARVLTGQQFLTDDVWTAMPSASTRVWQKSLPTLDIRPANLFPIENWKRYDLIDLRIAKPWGTWDVVGLFNYAAQPLERELDLGRLPLEAPRVHVFEFWSGAYLGRFARDARIARSLAPYQADLFAVVPAPADGAPVVLSTSRHISQGGLDLESVAAKRQGRKFVLSGRSSHLVARDAYEVVLATGAYRAVSGRCSNGTASVSQNGATARLRIVPARSGEADWEVTLERGAGEAPDPPVSRRARPHPNLALDAMAVASSASRMRYDTHFVNDGDAATRWQPTGNPKSASWIELAWEKATTLDRIVIDEVEGRIKEWRLEAEGRTIASGGSAGPASVVTLKSPVTISRLKLVIEKASGPPSIRELEVYHGAKN